MSKTGYFQKYFFLGFIVLSILTVLGCGFNSAFSKEEKKENFETIQTSQETPNEKADKLLSKMSLSQKVGQLFIFGIHGQGVNADNSYIINEFMPGGIIFFDRNMTSKEQTKHFVSDLNKINNNSNPIPLFIAIDQEGGSVLRMKEKLLNVPPAENLGKLDVNEAINWAHKSGKELKELGFNVNFAPVVDLGLAYGRSYSTNPEQVEKYAKAVGDSYYEEGLWFSYKHFPGIGKTKEDLHADSSVVTASKEELLKEDTKVFKDLVEKTRKNSYMIMVSHALYPAFDEKNPSSLSSAIMTQLLRKDIGFDGVVVIDDLEMGAVSNHYSFGDMAVKSILAGGDILLVCHEYAHMQEAYNGVLKAVKEGRISEDRLNQSVKRILLMKLSKQQ